MTVKVVWQEGILEPDGLYQILVDEPIEGTFFWGVSLNDKPLHSGVVIDKTDRMRGLFQAMADARAERDWIISKGGPDRPSARP